MSARRKPRGTVHRSFRLPACLDESVTLAAKRDRIPAARVLAIVLRRAVEAGWIPPSQSAPSLF